MKPKLTVGGFVASYSDARYVFFTDCATLFHPKYGLLFFCADRYSCLFELVKELESCPTAGAVTGTPSPLSLILKWQAVRE